jgi:hypothetical protein
MIFIIVSQSTEDVNSEEMLLHRLKLERKCSELSIPPFCATGKIPSTF